jgi:hypothetical protein
MMRKGRTANYGERPSEFNCSLAKDSVARVIAPPQKKESDLGAMTDGTAGRNDRSWSGLERFTGGCRAPAFRQVIHAKLCAKC